MAPIDLAFWICLMVLGFVWFLGLQARYFAGTALRFAVSAALPASSIAEQRAIIVHAVGGRWAPSLASPAHEAEALRLREAYPRALEQIRIGRLVSLLVPFLIAMIVIARRLLPAVL